jgi:hypothetical protein
MRFSEHLDDTDLLIALLDGPQIYDGTAWEIGYFWFIRQMSTYDLDFPAPKGLHNIAQGKRSATMGYLIGMYGLVGKFQAKQS